jgi:hypothetical protein
MKILRRPVRIGWSLADLERGVLEHLQPRLLNDVGPSVNLETCFLRADLGDVALHPRSPNTAPK